MLMNQSSSTSSVTGGFNPNRTSSALLEDYEYDVSESLDHYDWAELVPVVVVYSIVLLLGVSGNGMRARFDIYFLSS